jgi:hypothetical protein
MGRPAQTEARKAKGKPERKVKPNLQMQAKESCAPLTLTAARRPVTIRWHEG